MNQSSKLGSLLLSALLVAGIVASALAVIQSAHESRLLFGELMAEQRRAYSLDDEWGRLLIEKRTHASVDRVQQLAGEKLGMTAPEMKVIYLPQTAGRLP